MVILLFIKEIFFKWIFRWFCCIYNVRVFFMGIFLIKFGLCKIFFMNKVFWIIVEFELSVIVIMYIVDFLFLVLFLKNL